ncbi:MAG: hypothetical protein RL717_326 [Pseudomonadota bacterium]
MPIARQLSFLLANIVELLRYVRDSGNTACRAHGTKWLAAGRHLAAMHQVQLARKLPHQLIIIIPMYSGCQSVHESAQRLESWL